MRKLIVSLLIGMMAFYGTPFAFGASFNFEGIDNWGLGRAAMNIYIIGNLLTVEINNHSPIALNSPYTTPKDGFNVPGITGFGFEFLPQAVDMNSWILESYYFSGNGIKQSVIIGSNDETKIGPGPKEGRWTYLRIVNGKVLLSAIYFRLNKVYKVRFTTLKLGTYKVLPLFHGSLQPN